jgi:hypothetical protein
MATDNSVFTIPPITSVTVTPKANLVTDEDLKANNGVYLFPDSFNKTVPKSLVRIWANGNKIYIFDRFSSKLDYSFDEIFSVYKIFNDTQQKKLYIKNKTSNVSYISKNSTDGIVQFYERFAEGNFPRTTFNNTFYTKTDENILTNSSDIKNKKLNLYNIKPNEQIRLLNFNDNQEQKSNILNNNILLKIKSLFAPSDKPDIWKYFFSSVFLPNLDTGFGTFNDNTALEKNKNLKEDVQFLIDRNLLKIADFNIVSSRTIQGKTILPKNQKVKLIDVSQFTLGDLQNKKYYSLVKNNSQTNEDRRFIINKDNFSSFVGKTIVLYGSDGRIIPIKINNDFKTFQYLSQKGTGRGTEQNTCFSSFTIQPYYETIISNRNLIKSVATNSDDVLKTVPNNSQDIYDLLILDNNEYPNFPINGDQNRVLEITLDKNLTTKSQGDYYVMEIE